MHHAYTRERNTYFKKLLAIDNQIERLKQEKVSILTKIEDLLGSEGDTYDSIHSDYLNWKDKEKSHNKSHKSTKPKSREPTRTLKGLR